MVVEPREQAIGRALGHLDDDRGGAGIDRRAVGPAAPREDGARARHRGEHRLELELRLVRVVEPVRERGATHLGRQIEVVEELLGREVAPGEAQEEAVGLLLSEEVVWLGPTARVRSDRREVRQRVVVRRRSLGLSNAARQQAAALLLLAEEAEPGPAPARPRHRAARELVRDHRAHRVERAQVHRGEERGAMELVVVDLVDVLDEGLERSCLVVLPEARGGRRGSWLSGDPRVSTFRVREDPRRVMDRASADELRATLERDLPRIREPREHAERERAPLLTAAGSPWCLGTLGHALRARRAGLRDPRRPPPGRAREGRDQQRQRGHRDDPPPPRARRRAGAHLNANRAQEARGAQERPVAPVASLLWLT